MENEKPFTETIEMLAELKDEYILLESIRQCAKELVYLKAQFWNIDKTEIFNKLNELEHLVNTD